ncbi:MAG TPA: TetR/AcrR family transcriptional regulator [Aquihabitans sp.]|nr:TetR/AcrR family transcriptional regulator [Aquihabitans sp.]
MPGELPSVDIAEDPRISRTRRAVLDAAVELLVEGGADAVTIDAVVARSKVAKSTIYRHWDTRDDVLLAALHACGPDLEDPDPALGTVEALRRIVRSVAEMTSDPVTARAISTILLLRLERPSLQGLEPDLEKDQIKVLRRVLDRGVEEGVIRPGYDVQQASAHLVGPLIFAHITGSLPSDEALADQTVEVFLAYYGTGRG